MLHGSETWPIRKENEVALQRAEMKMVGWMCNAPPYPLQDFKALYKCCIIIIIIIIKVKDRVPSKELRERLGIDDIILILQQNRLRWYWHVL